MEEPKGSEHCSEKHLHRNLALIGDIRSPEDQATDIFRAMLAVAVADCRFSRFWFLLPRVMVWVDYPGGARQMTRIEKRLRPPRTPPRRSRISGPALRPTSEATARAPARGLIQSFARASGITIVDEYYDEAVSGADPIDCRSASNSHPRIASRRNVTGAVVPRALMDCEFTRDLPVAAGRREGAARPQSCHHRRQTFAFLGRASGCRGDDALAKRVVDGLARARTAQVGPIDD